MITRFRSSDVFQGLEWVFFPTASLFHPEDPISDTGEYVSYHRVKDTQVPEKVILRVFGEEGMLFDDLDVLFEEVPLLQNLSETQKSNLRLQEKVRAIQLLKYYAVVGRFPYRFEEEHGGLFFLFQKLGDVPFQKLFREYSELNKPFMVVYSGLFTMLQKVPIAQDLQVSVGYKKTLLAKQKRFPKLYQSFLSFALSERTEWDFMNFLAQCSL